MAMPMDVRSSGAILKILNLVAMADGNLAPEEENLLDSLADQYKLQAKLISWEDELNDPTDITELAQKISADHHELAMKTAIMVARVARGRGEDTYVTPEEDALLAALAAALALPPETMEQVRQQAAMALEKQPTLWQVLYGCFGSRFHMPQFG